MKIKLLLIIPFFLCSCNILDSTKESKAEPFTFSCSSTFIDFTDSKTSEGSLTLLKSSSEYSFEIINNIPWLSFDVLSGTVAEEDFNVTAYVDYSLFKPEEVKEGKFIITANSYSLTLTAKAKGLPVSDEASILETDYRSFTLYNGKDNSGSFNISNTGSGQMVYSINSDKDWLSLEVTSGSTSDNKEVEIPFNIDWSSIQDADLSKAIVTVTNHTVPVTTKSITIKAKSVPKLYVSKKKLTQKSNGRYSNSFKVGNSLARSLNYSITTDSNWLTLSSYSGDVVNGTDDIIEVSIDYTNFKEGVAQTSNVLISSDYGTSVVIVTATGYPSFSTSSINLTLKSISNPSENITVTNTGCGVLEYFVTTDCSWLPDFSTHDSIVKKQLNHGESGEIKISPDFNSLDWDVFHSGVLDLSIGSETKKFKIKAMRELPPEEDPRLHVNRSSITTTKDSQAVELFTITNSGTGIMNYTISPSHPFLIANKSAGSLSKGLSEEISFYIDWSLVTTETNAQIVINSDCVYSSDHIINVSLE